MEEQNIRMAIDRHWAASAAGDQVAEHEIYHDEIGRASCRERVFRVV